MGDASDGKGGFKVFGNLLHGLPRLTDALSTSTQAESYLCPVRDGTGTSGAVNRKHGLSRLDCHQAAACIGRLCGRRQLCVWAGRSCRDTGEQNQQDREKYSLRTLHGAYLLALYSTGSIRRS
jgi:hypothetical protein